MNSSAFTIRIGGLCGRMGMSLRGSCTTSANATQLEQALQPLLTSCGPHLYIDCQHLTGLTWQGQRVLLGAERLARTSGVTLYWCGMPESITTLLKASGLYFLMIMLPPNGYRGPLDVLHKGPLYS